MSTGAGTRARPSVLFERARQLLAGEYEPETAVQCAAVEAMPVNDSDWGTERQINAENRFFNLICAETGWDADADEGWSSWRLKATTEELIVGALVARRQV